MIDNSVHLITGGSGFIGSNIINYLLKKNNKIICIDNFSTGNIQNLKPFNEDRRLTIINHDVAKPFDYKCDYIWHFACPASPLAYKKDPIKTMKTCFNGTLNVLNIVKKYNSKLLFTSSSEIYGSSDSIPLREDNYGLVDLNSDRACYVEGKRIAETLCYEYLKGYLLDIKVVRIFNAYGPRMSINDKRVINSFLENGINNQNLIIYGDGNQTRSFCYIDDLLIILEKIMESNFSGPFNVGSDFEMSILDLAKLIKARFYPNISIEFEMPRMHEPKRRKPSLELVKKMFDWQPRILLEEGLDKTYEYLIYTKN